MIQFKLCGTEVEVHFFPIYISSCYSIIWWKVVFTKGFSAFVKNQLALYVWIIYGPSFCSIDLFAYP